MQVSKKDAMRIAELIKSCFNVYASGAFVNMDLSEGEIAELIYMAASHEHPQEAIEKHCDKIIGCM